MIFLFIQKFRARHYSNFKDTGNELDVLNLCNTSFNEVLILDAPFPVYVQALKKGLSSVVESLRI